MGGDETIDRLINFAKAQTALESLTTKQLASSLANRPDMAEALAEMGHGRYGEKDVTKAYIKGYKAGKLAAEIADIEDGRTQYAVGYKNGQAAALTPENLKTLGYVKEPAWRDARDIPKDHVEVVALVDFAGDLIPLIGHMPDPSAHKKFHAAQNNVLGVPLSMIRGWYPLPALPGKGSPK